MIIHCHNRRKLRIQAQADAEAAVAAQISRGCIKEPIKGDNPPEYEQPPSYYEAICELKWKEVVAREKNLAEKSIKRSNTCESDSKNKQPLSDDTKCVPLENVQSYI